jgi:hypothetical protein
VTYTAPPNVQVSYAAEEAVDLSYGDHETRARYLDWLYPADTPEHAKDMGSKQYGCLLHARACLREAGLDGSCRFGGREIDVLRCAYQPLMGQVAGMLQTLGMARGWLSTKDLIDVQPADILLIGDGAQTHGVVVVGVDGSTVHAVDGGQTDVMNGGKGTAIRRCVRTIGSRNGRVYLGDREIKWRIRT